MEKVEVRHKRTGKVDKVPAVLLDRVLRRGRHEVVEREPATQQAAEPEQADELESLSYAELRERAAEEGVQPDGRKKDDYIAALRQPGKYRRRDMQAEE